MKKINGTIAGLVVVAALWCQPAAAMKFDCFQQYAKNAAACSELSGFFARSLCGLDAGGELAECLRTGNKGR